MKKNEKNPEVIDILKIIIKKDYLRMNRWRLTHRAIGFFLIFYISIVPSLIATNVLEFNDKTKNILLVSISIFAILISLYNPLKHSQQRRKDKNDSRNLYIEYIGNLEKADNDDDRINICLNFNKEFKRLYESRGKRLIDYELEKIKIIN